MIQYDMTKIGLKKDWLEKYYRGLTNLEQEQLDAMFGKDTGRDSSSKNLPKRVTGTLAILLFLGSIILKSKHSRIIPFESYYLKLDNFKYITTKNTSVRRVNQVRLYTSTLWYRLGINEEDLNDTINVEAILYGVTNLLSRRIIRESLAKQHYVPDNKLVIERYNKLYHDKMMMLKNMVESELDTRSIFYDITAPRATRVKRPRDVSKKIKRCKVKSKLPSTRKPVKDQVKVVNIKISKTFYPKVEVTRKNGIFSNLKVEGLFKQIDIGNTSELASLIDILLKNSILYKMQAIKVRVGLMSDDNCVFIITKE